MSDPARYGEACSALEDIFDGRSGVAEQRLQDLGDWEIREIREAAAQLAALCRHLERPGKEEDQEDG